ncbi:MAG: hypothetical protein KGM42_09615 [Hyphomicrobiales bacterium]|nr:hypothetical protein [Hyphomicrobiales bacterium]
MTPEELARKVACSTLKLRNEARKFADAARARGDERQVRAMERVYATVSKQVVEFDLERLGKPPIAD